MALRLYNIIREVLIRHKKIVMVFLGGMAVGAGILG